MWALYLIAITWVLSLVAGTFSVLRTRVPGPLYAKFTSLILKYQEFSGKRRTYIHSLHQKYGPVVRLAPNEISFTDLEGLREIYQSGGSGYDKTEFYNLFQQYDHRTMFSTLNKQDHAGRKKLFADRYAMTNVVRPEIVQGIQDRAASVVEKCKASLGSYLDVYITLHCYALDCASLFLFNPGGTDTLNNPEDFVLMQELSYDNRLKLRWLEYYSPKLASFIHCFRKKSRSLSKDYVLAQSQQTKHKESSLIHRLQSNSSSLQTIQMAAECMDHMAAGIDTTGDGLCFLMYQLSLPAYQHVQQRLHLELVHNPTAKLDELIFLDAVVKEGLRLFPPIPMSLPRYVPDGGRNISGYDIPAATIVSCQAFSVHRINDLVFPRPNDFAPERWLAEEGLHERNRLFFSFASGGRGCIGKNLALVEMKTLLREIYSRFATKVAAEMEGDMSIDDQIISSRPKDQTCLLTFELIGK
ncbi:cytochrome P450 [Aspergillus alliaceus]|uniref:cytochrome P450 n=1 Tax=Petromyces alliaceus TaxID=209559 RepID=UPI0012A5C19C|nr:cytochrome P450 monooxygenase [Aspergillus alliaceus]KAB8235121.1 cytochrome P450 monooxygenase [Aspergillus alliaceus]